MAGLIDDVRTALNDAGLHESSEVGDPGFHVWPSRRTPGMVYVVVRLHWDKFEFSYTPHWGKEQIVKYSKVLTDAGFTVRQRDRIPVPRLAVTRPVESSTSNTEIRHE